MAVGVEDFCNLQRHLFTLLEILRNVKGRFRYNRLVFILCRAPYYRLVSAMVLSVYKLFVLIAI